MHSGDGNVVDSEVGVVASADFEGSLFAVDLDHVDCSGGVLFEAHAFEDDEFDVAVLRPREVDQMVGVGVDLAFVLEDEAV